MDYKGFKFRYSTNTGGKAGKGHNLTSSIHVVNFDIPKGRYFTYKLSDPNGAKEAVKKAIKWIDKILTPNPL